LPFWCQSERWSQVIPLISSPGRVRCCSPHPGTWARAG
jgi:hypothetical protein